MAHARDPREKLLNRIRRIRGQVEAIERKLEADEGVADVLCLIAASRGAMNSLMAEILEQHVRERVVMARDANERAEAVDELLGVIATYLK